MKLDTRKDSSREGRGYSIWSLAFKWPWPSLGLLGKTPVYMQREEFYFASKIDPVFSNMIPGSLLSFH